MTILPASHQPPRDSKTPSSSESYVRQNRAKRTTDAQALRLCELIARVTAAAFAVPIGELAAPSRRSAYVAFTRQCAMYLAHVCCGLSITAVGRGFGRDRATAAHACRLIEDRRDDPVVDAIVCSLECVCSNLRRCPPESVRP
jgi:hypothetical protein